ncbi:glycosyltransferase family 4 protein [Planktomarina sp.]|nr:glycosyltransferase family 4 protein [Planktomarina sp.]
MIEVIFVLMKFPVKSEVFATNEVIRLSQQNDIRLTVVSYRQLSETDKMTLNELNISNITIVTPEAPKSLNDFIQFMKNVTISMFHLAKITQKFNKEFFKQILIILLSSALAVQLRKKKINVIHLFWGHYPSWLLYYFKSDKRLKKILFLGAYDLELKLPISIDMAKNFSDYVITHSNVGVQKLKALDIPSDLIRLSYRGIDIEKLTSSQSMRLLPFKDRHGCISAGRLIPEKNFFEMVAYFCEILPRHPLSIYGNGPDEKRIIDFLQSKNKSLVNLKGFSTQTDLFNAFCQKKFFIFLSEKPGEILPNVVKEAMLARCVVICKSIPGIDELIETGVDGFLINSYNEIDEILSLPQQKLEIISERAFNKITENFSIDSTIINYKTVWGCTDENTGG